MAKIIMDIPDDEYNYFMYSEDFDDDGYDAIEYICNGEVIPDNATNGDVFIKTYQPMCIAYYDDDIEVEFPKKVIVFDTDWWNAPYKAEGEE